MAYEIPDSMDEIIYFSRRKLYMDKGPVITWVNKLQCPKCKKALMGKPVEKGKIKVRATEYICPGCRYTEPKAEHEAKLNAMIVYECPFCKHKDEVTAPFARKTWYGKKAIVFQCNGCKEKLGVVKKLGTPADFVARMEGKPAKGKAAKKEVVDPDDDDDF